MEIRGENTARHSSSFSWCFISGIFVHKMAGFLFILTDCICDYLHGNKNLFFPQCKNKELSQVCLSSRKNI